VVALVGPSTTWLLRRLSGWALACPDGVPVVLPELRESLSLGWSSGANSSVQRSMRRLIMFGLAHWSDAFNVRQPSRLCPTVSWRGCRRGWCGRTTE